MFSISGGNFLNAFAVSFRSRPLVCITRIVCGQQCATHVPDDVAHGGISRSTDHLGLAIHIGRNISVTAAGDSG